MRARKRKRLDREAARLRRLARDYLGEDVVAADIFVANSRDYGGGVGLASLLSLMTIMAERKARRESGVPKLMLWAVTPRRLYILKLNFRLGWRIRETHGAWERDEISPRRVTEKQSPKHEPPFAVGFTDPQLGRFIEAQALTWSPEANRVIALICGEVT